MLRDARRPRLHGRLRPAGRAGAARHRRPRDSSREMAATGADRVYLDLHHLPAERVRARFPQIDAFCLGYGLDITRDPIPVAPPRTTRWAACARRRGARRTCAGCTPAARRPARASTAPTAWPATRCSKGWCSAARALRAFFERSRRPRRLAADAQALPHAARRGEAGPPALDELQRLMWEKAGIVRTAGAGARASVLGAWACSAAAGTGSRRPRAGKPAAGRPAGGGGGAGAPGEPRRTLPRRLPATVAGAAAPFRAARGTPMTATRTDRRDARCDPRLRRRACGRSARPGHARRPGTTRSRRTAPSRT